VKAGNLIHSGALTAGLSHELNQFLAVIKLNAEQASFALKTDRDSSDVTTNLERIIKVNDSASKVITNLKRLFVTEKNTYAGASVDQIIHFVIELHKKG